MPVGVPPVDVTVAVNVTAWPDFYGFREETTDVEEVALFTVWVSADEVLPVKLVLEQKSWQGSTMTFALSAKMGFMSSPIKGTIDVTDRDVTIDADLGMFERFVSEDKVRGALATKFKGLLT